MATSIIGAYSHLAGDGQLLRLTLTESSGCGVTCPGINTTNSDLEFDTALRRAFIDTWHILGRPGYLRGVKCEFAPLDPREKLPQYYSGESLYGALSIALLRFFLSLQPASAQRHQIRTQLKNGVHHAELSRIAVSAAGGAAGGDFRAVEGMDQKLKAAARTADIQREALSTFVVARGQTVPCQAAGTVVNVTPEEYLRREGLMAIPILYAMDPMDALGKIFEGQSGALTATIT